MTTPEIYETLPDICAILKKLEEPHQIVFVGPTTNEIAPEGEWMKLTMAITNVARGGSKIVAVAPPRGEQEWETTRMKIIEMMNIVRDSAYATRAKVVTKIPQVPSISEPSLAVGIKPRKLETADESATEHEERDVPSTSYERREGRIRDENTYRGRYMYKPYWIRRSWKPGRGRGRGYGYGPR
ncbi:hypothetical protein Aduo_014137 [Ancylostoma duodenale]